MDNRYFKYSDTSLATPEDTAEIITLWKEVFNDSDAFIDFFFNHVYRPEMTLVIKRENRIVSMLQLLLYDFKKGNGHAKGSFYIYGACTRPSEQGKGYMHILMEEAIALAQLYYHYILFTIPATPSLFDFYKKAGLTHPINYLAETYQINKLPVDNTNYTFIQCQSGDNHRLFYEQIQYNQKGRIFLHREIYDKILLDLAIEGGCAYVALENAQPVGIVFAQPDSQNKPVIRDIIYKNIIVKNALIRTIADLHQVEMIEVRLPVYLEKNTCANDDTTSDPNNLTDKSGIQLIRQEIKPYGLACCSDPKTFLEMPDLFITLMYD